MESHLPTGSLVSSVVAAMLMCGAGRSAADTPAELPPLPPLRLDLDGPSCVMVCPPDEAYARLSEELGGALARATGRRPVVVADDAPPRSWGVGPAIVLGNVMHSAAARDLYCAAYDFTDYAWPGPGGYVLRTIRDPHDAGAHVLLVGGSDVEGVRRAARELVRLVSEQGPALGYLNQVHLGRWEQETRSYTEGLLGDDDEQWHRTGQSGSWDYQIAVAKSAIGYLRTGDEAYLRVFRREILRWIENDVLHPTDEAPQMLHGFVHTMLVPWDLIRDHPFFSDQDRARIDGAFLHVFRSNEGPGRIKAAGERHIVRDNHGTRTGLDAFFGGRYFLLRHALEEARDWLAIADAYFAPQMTSAKPVCDSWGHQWAASLFNTLVYAMAAGNDEYLSSEPLRLSAHRALVAHGRGEAPQGYLAACTLAADDPGFLTLEIDGEPLARARAAMTRNGDEYLRSFYTGAAVERREDLLGVSVAPVDPLWRATIDDAGFNPGGLFVDTVEPNEAFDKVSIREGFGGDDFYLLLDGISGGHHSYQDGNCIVRYVEGGVSWLAETARAFDSSASVRSQNGVFAALNAEGPGRIHRYARLLCADEKAGHCAIAGAAEGVGPVDWQRHIVRQKGAWTLVIDRLIPKASGEIIAERHWHVRGEVSETSAGLISRAAYGERRLTLHLDTLGMGPGGASGAKHRVERLRARVEAGARLEFAALVQVTDDGADPAYKLVEVAGGWSVVGAGGAATQVAAGDDGLQVTVGGAGIAFGQAPGAPDEREPPLLLELRPTAASADLSGHAVKLGGRISAVCTGESLVAAGTEDGEVAVLDPSGSIRWRGRAPTGVRSLHLLGEDLLVGEEEGGLSRFDSKGSQLWRVETPYVPMPWPYWSERKSRIREISSVDVDGDGSPEIVVSNSDRRVYAFTGDGEQLWKRPIEWGIYTAMTPGSYGGQPAIYGGTSSPSIHGWCIVLGADGSVLGHLTRPDLISWSVPSQFRDMLLADASGDGVDEAICGVDTNCRQVVVYRQSGEVLWDADMAGEASALAIQSVGGGLRVVAASSVGYVVALDAQSGERVWASYIGEQAALLWPDAGGNVLAACRSGRVFVISPGGELVGVHDLGSEISAVPRPGEHRRGAGALAVGTESGEVWTRG